MKTKTLSSRTLGLYLGCECEYEYYYYRDTKDNGWKKDSFEVDQDMFVEIKQLDSYRNHILILRPMDSMTEEERTIYFRLKETDVMQDHDTFESMDWLRSRGFDCGGWIIQITESDQKEHPKIPYLAGKKTITEKIVWVPSLIKEGLAKPKNTKQ